MADDIQNPSSATPSQADSSASVQTTNSTVSAPVETPSAAVAAPAVAEGVKAVENAPATEPTILGSEKPAESTQTPNKDTGEVNTEVKADAEQSADSPVPTYEPFNVPEGISLDKVELDKFTSDLAEFERTSKADHAEVQKFGQALIEKYVAELKTTAERINESHRLQQEERKTDYLQLFKDDSEIGKNRLETSTETVRSFIDRFGGNKEQIAEFRTLMANEPVANHPAILRVLLNADAQLKKYETEQSVRQLTAVPRAPKLSPREKFYGKKAG